jgi:monofunctional biosynthetic peptidoglycan transglycosylase
MKVGRERVSQGTAMNEGEGALAVQSVDVPAEATGMAGARGTGARGRKMWRWLKKLALALAAIAVLPLVLTPVYLIVPPVSTLMLVDLLSFQGYTREWVDLDDIAPDVARSVVMGEDGQYCFHDGVDWGSLRSVIDKAGRKGPSRGASTIPMQTVKNVFLWNSRSYLRKALEIPLALYTDLVWSKRRTMEIYLNIAELGPNLYGVGAASRAYFGKPASKLNRHEAALIAAALPSPLTRNPKKPSRAQKLYARVIEARVAKSGAYVKCLGR